MIKGESMAAFKQAWYWRSWDSISRFEGKIEETGSHMVRKRFSLPTSTVKHFLQQGHTFPTKPYLLIVSLHGLSIYKQLYHILGQLIIKLSDNVLYWELQVSSNNASHEKGTAVITDLMLDNFEWENWIVAYEQLPWKWGMLSDNQNWKEDLCNAWEIK